MQPLQQCNVKTFIQSQKIFVDSTPQYLLNKTND